MRKIKKTIYTLLTNGFGEELAKMTFPLIKMYANKIEADFYLINERKFPDKYPTYEKFQIWDLCKERQDDWSFFIDYDTMIHPDFFDPTACLNKDTTCSGFVSDFTPLRFRPDEYFLRDGRFFGKGTWFIVFSDWCRDIFHPLNGEDISYEDAIKNMFPVMGELIKIKKTAESLIDDYLVSRNIARFGLKHVLLADIAKVHNFQPGHAVQVNLPNGQVVNQVDPFIAHDYNLSYDQKLVWAEQILKRWGITI